KRSEGACWRAQRVVKLANLVMNETDVTASSNIPVIELCATVREGQSAIKSFFTKPLTQLDMCNAKLTLPHSVLRVLRSKQFGDGEGSAKLRESTCRVSQKAQRVTDVSVASGDALSPKRIARGTLCKLLHDGKRSADLATRT